MGSERAVALTEVKGEYLDDFFSDEHVLLEELEVDDFLVTSSSANEDLWDVLDISDDDWDAAQPDGFFMF